MFHLNTFDPNVRIRNIWNVIIIISIHILFQVNFDENI